MNFSRFFALCLCAALLGCKSASHHGHPVQQAPQLAVLDTDSPQDMQRISAHLAGKRVVFVGEIHDRYDHHRNQLRIIRAFHAAQPDMAIGMEYFQQPFQPHLDAYIAGTLSEKEMLEKTEYFSRWQIDYRQLRPIMEFARDNRIPLVALNIAEEIHHKVVTSGMDSLTSEEKAALPVQIDRSDAAYRERLQEIFSLHPETGKERAERLIEGQLLWDEAMAERAARYLEQHPGARMVVLAGAGHVAHGAGIPARLERRLPGVETASLVTGDDFGTGADVADFMLAPGGGELPPAGKMGVVLENSRECARIVELVPDGAARAAGVIREDDCIIALDGAPVQNIAGIKIAMLDKKPGDRVQVKILRSSDSSEQNLSLELVLR